MFIPVAVVQPSVISAVVGSTVVSGVNSVVVDPAVCCSVVVSVVILETTCVVECFSATM